MKKKQIAGMIIGLASFILLGVYYGWGLAAIIFLMLFGNNLEQSGRK